MGDKTVDERRVHARILTRVLVDFDSSDTYLYDYSNDLSEGGIFIETENPLPSGSELTLRFTLPNIDRVFEVKGTVKWKSDTKLQDANPQKKMPRGMGIQFSEMEDIDREMIRKYVQESLAKQGY